MLVLKTMPLPLWLLSHHIYSFVLTPVIMVLPFIRSSPELRWCRVLYLLEFNERIIRDYYEQLYCNNWRTLKKWVSFKKHKPTHTEAREAWNLYRQKIKRDNNRICNQNIPENENLGFHGNSRFYETFKTYLFSNFYKTLRR